MSSFFNRLRPSKRKTQTNNVYRSSAPSSTTSSTASLARHGSVAKQPAPPTSGAPTTTIHSQSTPTRVQSQPMFLQAPFVKAALVKGSFQTICELPNFVDINEWLALNVFEFNSHIQLFCTTLSEFMDPNVPMNAGPGNQYAWLDAYKQALQLPAATYIDYSLSWIQAKFDDQTLFPTRQGVPFPAHFQQVIRAIYVQQFRIFAYIYHNLFGQIVHLSMEPHFNSLFCFFVSFGKTFQLLDRGEAAPLTMLIQNFETQGKIA